LSALLKKTLLILIEEISLVKNILSEKNKVLLKIKLYLQQNSIFFINIMQLC